MVNIETIRLFIPPIYYKWKECRRNRNLSVVAPLPMRERKGDRMIIIGNGPSLNKTMELYGDIVCNTECMMVNFSASTPLFERIKPTVYVLLDPAWFAPGDNIKESISSCLNDIKTKTQWPMTFVLPDSVKNNEVALKMAENPNISLAFFYNGVCPYKDMPIYEALDKNLISPPGQTVLNTCVWLSIYWGYKETYLIGADTSFLADELIDQETNEVYTIDRHFYSNDEVYKDKDLFKENRRIIHSKFHEELISVATALKGYWDMREYAEWKGVKVYNASEYSWIDAFERKKLC